MSYTKKMFVIIPHPTEELKLINFQKKLIKKNNDENTILYACQPLWIELPDFDDSEASKAELKNFSKTIKEIIIKNTDYYDDEKKPLPLETSWESSKETFQEAAQNFPNEIFLPVEIITQDATIKSKIPLLRIYKGQLPQNLKNQKSPVEKLKIFRIAKTALYSENQKSLQDFIWCKLKG